jgi:hypothetical protein
MDILNCEDHELNEINNFIEKFDILKISDQKFILDYLTQHLTIDCSKYIRFCCYNNIQYFYKIEHQHIKDKIINILKEKIDENIKKINYQLNMNTSLFFNYLSDVTNFDNYCVQCNKIKIYFEYCVYCDQKKDYINHICLNLKNIINENKLDNKKCVEEIDILLEKYDEHFNNVENLITNYNKQCVYLDSIVNFDNVLEKNKNDHIKYVKLLFNSNISYIEKANKFIDMKYYNFFNNIDIFTQMWNFNNITICVKDYIISIIKKRHISQSVIFLKKLRHKIYYYDKNSEINIKCKYIKSNSNTCFMYDLLNNEFLMSKIIMIKNEPEIIILGKNSMLRLDFFFLFKIDKNLIPMFLEIDDYVNYEKLKGGHDIIDRKYKDILKDMFCFSFCISLVRTTSKEQKIMILENIIKSNTNLIYRFYDGYFNNKKKKISGFIINV